MRTRIKICGMTRIEDALCAVENGADALGFILVPESPRFIGRTPELNFLLTAVKPLVARVGVCRKPDDIQPYTELFDTIQFYEPVHEQILARYGKTRLVYACPVQGESSLEAIANTKQALRFVNGDLPLDALLLDTYHKDKLGGSGETFNWELAVEAKQRFGLPIILAGGLTPENVGEAVRKVRPYAVDVSSGVETSPGIKDHKKIADFCRAVREADLS